jgi:hypothetical protein
MALVAEARRHGDVENVERWIEQLLRALNAEEVLAADVRN